ncbi:hypothetical protein SARC_16293 [Sphaeroforma arctica JP610]|uniref:Uncharacterized protein n=1 Tax=Sphaeroforma arctica JP610 TaxID=667725 RepID=A0A0L0F370_9EUKA|nr:hypothetical protein SARC_16293 [Sphaeroforma arctica JP610]KNC71170.1 hypothetical protein SARC_16293 [Sphaeroforma arctica JP610]|eukprot:XP_014145072.1 hypothetical protein SARC_16293 [Sphaeroforma arctica JP610]
MGSSLLQGPGTSFENTSRCRLAIKRGQPFETKFVNYKKDGERFKSKMRLIPVLGKDKEMAPTFYLGLQYDTSTSTRTDASYTFESLAEYIMANNNL